MTKPAIDFPPVSFGRVLLVLLGLAITPVALVRWVGSPIPSRAPTLDDVDQLLKGITPDHLAAVFGFLLWMTWAVIVVGAIGEIVAYTRHRARPGAAPARRPWFVRLTGGLVLGATATTTVLTPTAAIADDTTDTHDHNDTSTPPRDRTPPPEPRATTEPDTDSAYTVRQGDTLWGIAETELDDGTKWKTIYDDNRGQDQPGGATLSDPNLIQPGWQLDLPGTEADDPVPGEEPDEADTEPPPESSTPGKPPAPSEAEASTGTDDSTADASGVWWSGGFVATAFAAGLVLLVRRARQRVRDYEQHTQRTGPRVRLAAPLNELTPLATEPHDPDAPVAVGTTGAEAVPLLETATGGLGLTGEGSDAAARAAMAAALTHGDQDAASNGCDVITTARLLARLCDSQPAPGHRIHRLWTYRDSDAALRALARHLAARTRDPDDDVRVLAVFDDDVDRAALAPILKQGKELGISAIVLGDWPHQTITVDDDGATDTDSPTRCHILTATAFTATLSTLEDIAEVYTEPVTPATEPDDHDGTRDHGDSTKTNPDVDPPPTASSADAAPPGRADEPSAARVRLRLFGDVAVAVDGQPVRIRRTKSRELLAYLATRSRPAPLDDLLEAIVGDTAFDKARCHFDAVVTYARKDLRQATGQPNTTMFVLHERGTYRLDPDRFSTDLNAFDEHLAEAANSSDPQQHEEHLTAALELYAGEVAADIDTDSTWPYPIRAHYAERARDTCLQLAEHATSRDDTETAVELLERAITIDRYHQDAYTRLIALHRQHDDPDQAARVHARLKTALAAIGTTPNTERTKTGATSVKSRP